MASLEKVFATQKQPTLERRRGGWVKRRLYRILLQYIYIYFRNREKEPYYHLLVRSNSISNPTIYDYRAACCL